jgi:hypothetical protein
VMIGEGEDWIFVGEATSVRDERVPLGMVFRWEAMAQTLPGLVECGARLQFTHDLREERLGVGVELPLPRGGIARTH